MRYNARSYDQLIQAIKIFQRMIAPLELSAEQVVHDTPRSFRMALKASAGAAGTPASWLALVVFGQTLDGHSSVRAVGKLVHARKAKDRLTQYGDPCELVQITFGDRPQVTQGPIDNSASLSLFSI